MSFSSLYDEHYFVVSADLLKLFRWLLIHEQDTLKTLVRKALESGHLSEENNTEEESSPDALKEHVVQFFMLLETCMHELQYAHGTDRQIQRLILPAAEHIDGALYDEQAITRSIAKATATFATGSKKNLKDILCKELLRQWHPAQLRKKQLMN